jgi:hypothetical protein
MAERRIRFRWKAEKFAAAGRETPSTSSARTLPPRTAALHQQCGKLFLALRERIPQPSLEEKPIRHCFQWSHPKLVLNHILDQRPAHALARVHHKLVPMVPALEWTFLLYVGEVMVPFEFSDACDPGHAQRKKREEAKRSGNDRADSRGFCKVNRIWRRWRRDEDKLIDSGLRSGGHDARQILGVREEGEDVRCREGNPVGELELSGQVDGLCSRSLGELDRKRQPTAVTRITPKPAGFALPETAEAAVSTRVSREFLDFAQHSPPPARSARKILANG